MSVKNSSENREGKISTVVECCPWTVQLIALKSYSWLEKKIKISTVVEHSHDYYAVWP